jgi:bacterioferritin-associated ferredoxin
MYLCLCKGITDRKVQELLDRGVQSKDIIKKLGLGSDCSVCLLEGIEFMSKNHKKGKHNEGK